MYWTKNKISFENQPFRPTSIRKLHCQYGPHYFKPKKRKTDRIVIQTTKKRECPAVITIREYEVFPDYAIKVETLNNLSGYAERNLRASKLKELSLNLHDKKEIATFKMYH